MIAANNTIAAGLTARDGYSVWSSEVTPLGITVVERAGMGGRGVVYRVDRVRSMRGDAYYVSIDQRICLRTRDLRAVVAEIHRSHTMLRALVEQGVIGQEVAAQAMIAAAICGVRGAS